MENITFSRLFERIIDNYLGFFPDSDLQVLYRAYNLAHICHRGQFRKDSNPYFFHPLSVAIILSEWGLDNNTIAAALLHDTVEDVDDDRREDLRKSIIEGFGDEIYNIVEGVTKKEKLPDISKNERKEVSLKKMFLHSSRDIRVILVKIADRLHNMRTLDTMASRKQSEISRETLAVYIPLTKVLGLHFAAREMEDLCLYYLNRRVYEQLDSLVDKNTYDIESQFTDFKETLNKALRKSGIKILRLEKRNKNLFSVLKKYLRKDRAEDIDYSNIVLDELILTEIVKELNVVITVGSKIEIGKVIGVINSHFQYMPNTLYPYWENEFFDHFIQVGDTYGNVNIGFRCEEENFMRLRNIAEKAKFSFNVKKTTKDILESFLSFSKLLREVQALRPTSDFYKIFEDIVSSPQILVFTSENHSILIPENSTALDLFVLLNDLGMYDYIKGIKAYINGQEAELSRRLANNDRVDIITAQGETQIEESWIEKVELSITRDIIKRQFERQELIRLVERGRDKFLTKLRINQLGEDILNNSAYWSLVEERLGINDSENTFTKLNDDPVLLEKLIDIAVKNRAALAVEPASLIPKKIRSIFRSFNKQALCLSDINTEQLIMCKRCKPLTGEYITGIWESNMLYVHRLDREGVRHISDPKECIPLKWGSFSLETDVPVIMTVVNKIGNLERLLKKIEKLGDIKLLDISHSDQGETSEIRLSFKLTDINQLNSLSKMFKKIDFINKFSIRDIDA